MYMKIAILIRWILTGLWLCAIYTEAGFWTAAFAFMVFVNLELGYILKARYEELKKSGKI